MATKIIAKENGGGIMTIPDNTPQIYGLIGQAMREIGAVCKDKKNPQQGFMYRGIDAVYNALSPVMAKLGLFLVPEILEQNREERQTKSGSNLIYSILKIRYTVFAPDGSHVSAVVIGEAMDNGDKSCNKAMSAAFKYAAFQLFCIPTEEMIDPDAEVHSGVLPKGQKPAEEKPAAKPAPTVTTTPTVPALQQAVDNASKPIPGTLTENAVLTFLAKERAQLAEMRQIPEAENAALWKKQFDVLKGAGLAPNKPLSSYTHDEAAALVRAMYDRFDPTGTEIKAAEE